MEKTAVQRFAKVLKVLVTVTLICNLAALFFVPGMYLGWEELVRLRWDIWEAGSDFGNVNPLYALVGKLMVLFSALALVWFKPVAAVYTLFLWGCGCCSAVILWQGRAILDTILEGNPFQMKNAHSMKRAAECCWVVAGMALIRLAGELWFFRSPAPIFTYNAVFIPIFVMAGLLFLVMSALFRQAAELKEDQDLTI